jgi:hypothetical protein
MRCPATTPTLTPALQAVFPHTTVSSSSPMPNTPPSSSYTHKTCRHTCQPGCICRYAANACETEALWSEACTCAPFNPRYGYCHYEWLTGGNAAACQCGAGPVALSTPPIRIPMQPSFYAQLVCNAAPCDKLRQLGARRAVLQQGFTASVTPEQYAQQCESPPCQLPCLVGGCPKYALAPSPPGSRPREAYVVGPEDTDALPRLGCRVKGCPGWVPPGQLVCRGVDCLTNGEECRGQGKGGGGEGGRAQLRGLSSTWIWNEGKAGRDVSRR